MNKALLDWSNTAVSDVAETGLSRIPARAVALVGTRVYVFELRSNTTGESVYTATECRTPRNSREPRPGDEGC